MRARLLQSGLAAAAIVACAAVALLLPPLWTGISGRDFRPQATAMAILLVVAAIGLRRGLRWPVMPLVLGLAAIELLTLLVIAAFSGYGGTGLLDEFNLLWLAYMNLFIGLPWLLGLVAGSIWLRRAAAARQPGA